MPLALFEVAQLGFQCLQLIVYGGDDGASQGGEGMIQVDDERILLAAVGYQAVALQLLLVVGVDLVS